MHVKQRCMILFFNFLIISSICRFTSSFYQNIILVWEKHQLPSDHHTGWPLCKLWEHRFLVPDLVFSPPNFPSLAFSFFFFFFTHFPKATLLQLGVNESGLSFSWCDVQCFVKSAFVHSTVEQQSRILCLLVVKVIVFCFDLFKK